MTLTQIGEYITVGGIIAVMITIIQNYFRERKKSRYTRHFESRAKVYRIMDRVISETGAKRFLIFKTTNGGGRPRLGANLYIHCLYEDYRDPFRSVKADYQRLIADRPYVNMLIDIAAGRTLLLDTEQMEDQSLLRRIYESEGVRAAIVFPIVETPDAFIYGSIATDEEGLKKFAVDPYQLKIELGINKLRAVFQKAHT